MINQGEDLVCPSFQVSNHIKSFIPEAINYLSPPLTLLCSGWYAELCAWAGQAEKGRKVGEWQGF